MTWWLILSVVETGFITPAILGAACLLWHLGVRDELLLTLLALALGSLLGWQVNELFYRFFGNRTRSKG
jgi:hypothetical protein